jgi:hypothetical protein
LEPLGIVPAFFFRKTRELPPRGSVKATAMQRESVFLTVILFSIVVSPHYGETPHTHTYVCIILYVEGTAPLDPGLIDIYYKTFNAE